MLRLTPGRYQLRSIVPLAGLCLSALACNTDQPTSADDSSLAPRTGLEAAKGPGGGGGGGGDGGLLPLSSVPVPRPTNSTIVNQAAAVRLGKALFWEIQTGGNGRIACATCHFKAGADGRETRGSQGMLTVRSFLSVDADANIAEDVCTDPAGAQHPTGRNTPTAVNAVFLRQIFWDGRANDRFNGKNPFGFTGNNSQGSFIRQLNAALASQSVGPPNNDVEMSCADRPFNGHNAPAGSLATKLLARTPLGKQQVSPNDGVLGGSLVNPSGMGLSKSYLQLINDAFGPTTLTRARNKFSSFWGQAIQAYESTLIADQTPLDKFLRGDQNALGALEQRGLNRFTGKGNCTKCHAGAELTDASISFVAANGLRNEDGGDQGFHNIGVSPTAEDLGRAGSGPNNVSFSESGGVADRGAFKTAALRNVKLTAPYFHHGQAATLEDVVDFYIRGGDFNQNNPEFASRMKPISFDSDDKAAVVAFLRHGLTDCRVERERAPFDHPQLPNPDASLSDLADAVGGGGGC